MMATAIPSVIFGPFSGAFTDKIRYKKVLIATNILRFLVVILLIPAAHNTLAILELIFLMSTITQFFSPAELSSIPLIVKKDKLVAANSIYLTTMYGSLILGYGIAGPLQAIIGSYGVFLVIAGLYAVCSILVYLMSEYDQKEIKHNLTLRRLEQSLVSIWQSTRSGLSYIRHRQKVYSPMFKLTVAWAMLGSFVVVLPGFAEKTLHISTEYAGIILIVPAGVGMLIASWALNRWQRFSKNTLIFFGFIVAGLALLAMSLYSFYNFLNFSLLIATALMIIMGFAAACVYVPAQTLLQINSDGPMRGRVYGISAMFLNLAMSIPALFIGGIADLTSPTITLILVAFVIIFYGASLYFEDDEPAGIELEVRV